MKKTYIALLLSLAISSSAKAASSDSAYPSKPDGEVAGHGYVDLGLPSGTLWATCNIGAEDYYYPGEYFAWGETRARDIFTWRDYQFFDEEYTDSPGQLSYTVEDIGEVISGTDYDAARIQWGDMWRMPTKEDYEELKEHCIIEYWEAAQISPRKGLRISGPSGKSILLPNTFSPHGGIITAVLRGGEYWTATSSDSRTESSSLTAMQMNFGYERSELKLIPDGRHDGLSIRPVINRQDIGTSVATMTDDTPYMTFENGSITVKGYAHECRLAISDLSGRRVLDTSLTDGKCEISNLPDGIYLATLLNAGKALKTIKISIK